MSISTQAVIIVLGFVTRAVFVEQLGVTMLGVNALMISVLGLLALADLGINGALMYALYKPLRDGDTRATAAIVRYAGRLFRWVALGVTAVGLALVPFIPSLVRAEEPVEHVQVYYLVLLADTALAYLMMNRTVLLNADQKIYVTKTYTLIFSIVRSIAQIVVLLVSGSFLLFLVIQVLATVSINVFAYRRAGRIYPYLKEQTQALAIAERRSILRSTRSMLIYRATGLVLQNSTALLISVLVGTVALGHYSNYMLMIGAAVMVVEATFSALTPSVGSLVAVGDRKASRRVFDEIVLLAVLVHGLIAIGFIAFADDVMVLWLGADFVMPISVVIAIALNFYVVGSSMPLWSFRNATGLFHQAQFVMLATAGLSLALSFALAPAFGLVGVVAAPVLARVLTVAWFEPWLLVRNHLAGRSLSYFALQIGALALWTVIAGLVLGAAAVAPGGQFGAMLAKVLSILVLTPAAVWLVFGRMAAFRALSLRLSLIVRRVRGGRS